MKTMSLKQKEQSSVLEKIENAITGMESRIRDVAEKAVSIEAFTQLQRTLQESQQREDALRLEVKKMAQLFEELFEADRLQIDSTAEIMNELKEWRAEVTSKLSQMDEKVAYLSSRQSSLWKESRQERHLSQKSSTSLSLSVSTLEEEIRGVKRQLTDAVSLFRKQRNKVYRPKSSEDKEDAGAQFRQSVMRDISASLDKNGSSIRSFDGLVGNE